MDLPQIVFTANAPMKINFSPKMETVSTVEPTDLGFIFVLGAVLEGKSDLNEEKPATFWWTLNCQIE